VQRWGRALSYRLTFLTDETAGEVVNARGRRSPQRAEVNFAFRPAPRAFDFQPREAAVDRRFDGGRRIDRSAVNPHFFVPALAGEVVPVSRLRRRAASAQTARQGSSSWRDTSRAPFSAPCGRRLTGESGDISGPSLYWSGVPERRQIVPLVATGTVPRYCRSRLARLLFPRPLRDRRRILCNAFNYHPLPRSPGVKSEMTTARRGRVRCAGSVLSLAAWVEEFAVCAPGFQGRLHRRYGDGLVEETERGLEDL
jgi:hypothetical protein